MDQRVVASRLIRYWKALTAWSSRWGLKPCKVLTHRLPHVFKGLAALTFMMLLLLLILPWRAGFVVEAQTEILTLRADQKLISWWLQDARIKLDVLETDAKVDCGIISGSLTLRGNMEISYEIRDKNVIFLRATSQDGLYIWLRTARRKFVDCGAAWRTGVRLAAVYVTLGEAGSPSDGGNARSDVPVNDPGSIRAATNWPTLALAGQIVLGRLPSDQADQNNPLLIRGTVRTLARSWLSNEIYEATNEDLLLGDTLHFVRTEKVPHAEATESVPVMGFGQVRVEGAADLPYLHVVWRTAGAGSSYRISHYGSTESEPPGLSIVTRIIHDPTLQFLLALTGVFATLAQLFQVIDKNDRTQQDGKGEKS